MYNFFYEKTFFIHFTQEKKEKLLKEIQQKNQELRKTKLLLKEQVKQAVVNSSLNLEVWQNNQPELKLRLLYY